MTIILPRRSFLVGLGSLMAAPAIVHASSLMPVKAFDPYYTRCIAAYHIGTDSMILRIDKSLVQLPIPSHVQNVELREAYRLIPSLKKVVDGMRPQPGQQLHVDALLPGGHYHTSGGSARTSLFAA